MTHPVSIIEQLRREPMVTRVTMPFSFNSGTMLSEELLAIFCVAEGFRASRTRGGKSACQISGSEAHRQIGALQILMEEASVKTVPRSHRVHGLDCQGGAYEALGSALCQRALAAALHHDQRYQRRKFLHRRFQIAASCRFLSFPLIRQEHVDIAQRLMQAALPAIVGIVVGIERNAESGFFHSAEQLRHSWPQPAQQVERRKV